MTIRLIEGFDYYPSIAGTAGVNAAWTFDNTASVALIAGRFGGQAISGNAGSAVTRTLTGAGLMINQIAKMTDRSRQATGQMLRRMEDAGLVEPKGNLWHLTV
jgi:hypothetical protein